MQTSIVWFFLPGSTLSLSPIIEALSQRFSVQKISSVSEISITSNTSFFIFIVSVDLPRRETLLLIRELRFNYPQMPIFFLAREYSPAIAERLCRAGVMDYFIFPLPEKDLTDRIEIYINRQKTNLDHSSCCNSATLLEFPFNDPSLKNLYRYIEKNYRAKITLDDAARQLSMGSYQFCRFFKKIAGQGFKEYLVDYRLQRAMEWLLITSDTITEVAISAGFNDLSNFQRLFRKKTGMTPRQYRKRQRGAYLQESPHFVQESPRQTI